MCGIGGQLVFKGPTPERQNLKRMARSMAHRGPDGEGLHIDGPVGLVHRRLAVLDLTNSGHQPLVNPETGDVLVFNGEIYNHSDLRRDLLSQGKKFIGRSDSEVLMLGLSLYGSRFLAEIDGDFAFAFWEKNKGELIVARDRFGVKPLYWYANSQYFLFSSEVRALRSAGFSGIHLDLEALESYFALRYVRGQKTAFKNVYKVRPGYFLRVSSCGKITSERYWQLRPSSKRVTVSDLLEKFSESVKRRTSADVDVGAFLSGGVDSSAVAALVPEGLPTFSYDMPHSQDAEQAASLASWLGLKHSSLAHSPNLFEMSQTVLQRVEEPIGDSILVANDALFQFTAKAGLKVALSGEGADEVFGGFMHHQAARRLQRMPEVAKWFVGQTLGSLPTTWLSSWSHYPAFLGVEAVKRAKLALSLKQDPWKLHLLFSELWTRAERDSFLFERSEADSVENFQMQNWPKQTINDDLFLQFILFDMQEWLPNYGLLRVDKLSMWHGLEVRVPYLSHLFVEKALGFLSQESGAWRKNKKALRAMMSELLPAKNLKRAKFPFFLPVEKAYGSNYWKYVNDVLRPGRIGHFGFLNPKVVGDFLRRGSRSDHFLFHKKVTSLLHFQIWCELNLS